MVIKRKRTLFEIHETESGRTYSLVPLWWRWVLLALVMLILFGAVLVMTLAYINMGRIERLEQECIPYEKQ